MVLAHDDDVDETLPYWFARILGVFHVQVRLLSEDCSSRNTREVRMEFLWIRWFVKDSLAPWGWKARRLPRVGFVDANGDGSGGPAFGFLDPQHVIRGVHLIPAFHYGRTRTLLGPSIARQTKDDVIKDDNKDWEYFYVNMSVFYQAQYH